MTSFMPQTRDRLFLFSQHVRTHTFCLVVHFCCSITVKYVISALMSNVDNDNNICLYKTMGNDKFQTNRATKSWHYPTGVLNLAPNTRQSIYQILSVTCRCSVNPYVCRFHLVGSITLLNCNEGKNQTFILLKLL